MEYKRITSKGGVNIPVKLRRSMGIEPRTPLSWRSMTGTSWSSGPTRPAASTAEVRKSILRKMAKGSAVPAQTSWWMNT